MTATKLKPIYQLLVTLRDIDPPVWRRVQVVEDTKLPRLHQILQTLFQWEDCHLHEFAGNRCVYSVPDPEDAQYGRKVADEADVPLRRIVDRVGGTFTYLYDFGDGWRHEILLEAILLPEPDAPYPRCIAGARNAPPEDSGGPFGYANYLQALANRRHPDHKDLLAWRGPFDPEAFSLRSINAELSRQFHRRRAAAKAVAPAELAGTMSRKKTAQPAAASWQSPRDVGRKRIAPGTKLPLELTSQERELILNRSCAPDELTEQLKKVATSGKPAIARYTLAEWDELAGHAAAEANHTTNRKARAQWQEIFDKIDALLTEFTGEEP